MGRGYPVLWIVFVVSISVGLVNVLCETPPVDDDIVGTKQSSGTDSAGLDKLSADELNHLIESGESQDFSTDVSKMMVLIINSLYQNKEVFLRELISNAADAVDKIRFQSLTDSSVLSNQPELFVRVKVNPAENSISIRDSGIGMTRQELEKNLGTIAHSGTSDFVSNLTASNVSMTSDQIGQFGVGFYSAFLVAEKVTVISKSNDDDQHIWESNSHSFRIIKDPRGDTLGRGTEVILHLRDDAKEYLDENILHSTMKKYSQFVGCPLYLWQSYTENVVVEEDVQADDTQSTSETSKSDDVDVSIDDDDEKETTEPEKKKRTEERTGWDWKRVNDQPPVWTRRPSDVKKEEYDALFSALTGFSDEPLGQVHFSAEGEASFKAVLFVRKTPPHDYLNSEKQPRNVKLYVRRIFITDDVEEMLPSYLSFVYGVVDSDSLPLNVSRETLQAHKILKLIKKKLVSKLFEMLRKMSKDTYDTFWQAYRTSIKIGVIQDPTNKPKLLDLLRMYSSHNETELTSFADYTSRMKENQEAIYYIVGQSIDEIKQMPFLERVRKMGYEVLYFIDPIDNYIMERIGEVKGHKLQDLAKRGVDLQTGEDAKEKFKKLEDEFKPLIDWLQNTALVDKISRAQVSQRLTDSPCAVVADAISGSHQKVLISQAYSAAHQDDKDYYIKIKNTFEINPRHPLIKTLNERVKLDPNDQVAQENALLLFETATLRSGFIVPDLTAFAQRVENAMRQNLDISLEEPVETDDEIPSEFDEPIVTEEDSATDAAADMKEEL